LEVTPQRCTQISAIHGARKELTRWDPDSLQQR